MSVEQVRDLYGWHPFEPRLPRDWLIATHVPFDGLFANEAVETRVRSGAGRGTLLSVIGGPGTGKTSLVSSAVNEPSLWPIWVEVTLEGSPPVTDPLGFAQLLLTTIVDTAGKLLRAKDVERALEMAGERHEQQGRRATRRGVAGLTSGWGTLDVAREVTTAAPDISRRVTANEVTRRLDRLFDEVFASRQLMPVVVVDDSDRFLQVVALGKQAPPDLLGPFAARVLPWLAERNCAKVISVHPAYRDRPEWAAARLDGRAGEEVLVPRLDRADQLGEILAQRLVVFADGVELHEVVHDDAVTRLFELYSAAPTRTLRTCLTVANTALVLAYEQGAATVTRLHVDAAQADLE
jgi:hypothetical protein